MGPLCDIDMWKRLQKSIFFYLIGMVFGVGVVHLWGGVFIAPQPLSASWNVRSPATDELAGIPQIGQGIAISNGRLRIRQQQLYPSDQLFLQSDNVQGTFGGVLDESSGMLVVGFLGETEEYVFLTPKELYLETPMQEGLALEDHRFQFVINEEGVFAEPQHVLLTADIPRSIVLMTASPAVSIVSLQKTDAKGKIELQEEYDQQGRLPYRYLWGVVFGLVWGWILSAIWKGFLQGIIRCTIAFFPMLLLLSIPQEAWLRFAIQLYLVQTPVWDLMRYLLFASVFFAVAYACMHAKIFRLRELKKESNQWTLIWVGAFALCLLLFPPQSLVQICTMGAFVLSPLLLGSLLKKSNFLLLECGVFLVLGWYHLSLAMVLLLGVRWVVLLSNLSFIFEREKNGFATYAAVLLLAPPFLLEDLFRATYLNTVWSAKSLGVQSEDIPEGLPLTWKGACSGEQQQGTYDIVVSGGSSTGGIYQFREEPTSFFSTHMHKALCQYRSSFAAVHTYNYGVADYNTRLIADQGGWLHKTVSPDVLVLYIGVNDILTKQNPKSIRQRREMSLSPWFQNVVFSSRVLTGTMLLFRPLQQRSEELVSEVPIEDARANILEMIEELKPIRLLLVPEMVISPLQDELLHYDEMLRELANERENIWYYQPLADRSRSDSYLADRNHLTRSGNQWLGEQIAQYIRENLVSAEP